MRAYVLTRSAYGPEWTLEANRRRLEVTAAVTARLMAAQTDRDWTWVVLLHEQDPLRVERTAVFAAAAPRCSVVPWTPPARPSQAPWDRHAATKKIKDAIAYEAYRAPWSDALGDRDEAVMQVRLDDDDGLAVDALVRYRRAAMRLRGRSILMLPYGVRVWDGRYSRVRHERNAMHALLTPPGDAGTVYDYPHAECHSDRRARGAPVLLVDDRIGWLWLRHRDTLSGWKRADRSLDRSIRKLFPIDWSVIT